MKKGLMYLLMCLMLISLVMTGCASIEAATSNKKVAAGGCEPTAPPKIAAVTVPPAAVTAVQKEVIYFDFDKSIIMASEQAKITKVVGWMKDPKANAIVIGYTDPIGTDNYNLELSKKRAEAVKAALVKAGVPADKIKVEYKGETNLVKPGLKSIKENAPNRRAEVEVVVK